MHSEQATKLFSSGAFNLPHELLDIEWRSLIGDIHIHPLHWECRSHAVNSVCVLSIRHVSGQQTVSAVYKAQHLNAIPDRHDVSFRSTHRFERIRSYRGTWQT